MKSYAGIGSRNITNQEKEIIKKISSLLSKLHYLCYSGNADGSDIAFQENCSGQCVVFLPWDGFNKDKFDYDNKSLCKNYYVAGNSDAGLESVEKFHPNPSVLSRGGRSLMCRNYYQIMGWYYIYPRVDFVICCADEDINGNVLGGTGQATRIAKSLNIPIFNIRNKNWKDNFKTFLKN